MPHEDVMIGLRSPTNQNVLNGFKTPQNDLSCLFMCSLRTSERHVTEMTILICSLPQVVFTAAFLKILACVLCYALSPVSLHSSQGALSLVCSLSLSLSRAVLVGECLPPNLVKRELASTPTLSLYFLKWILPLSSL